MCTWFDCTEYSTTRNVSRSELAAIERRRNSCASLYRKLGNPARSLIVTSTGCRAHSLGLLACDTPARSPFGFLPAPFRFPPQFAKPNSR